MSRPIRASEISAGALAALTLTLTFVPACARGTRSAAPVESRPPALTAATGEGRIGSAEPYAPGTRVGATVKAPIVVFPDRMAWDEPPPMVSPGAKMAILEGDPTAPNNALFTLRMKLPANYRFMPHWHPTDEHVTVLSGSLLIGHGDSFAHDQMTELPAGGFAVLPAGHHHFAAAGNTEAIVQIHAVGPFEFNYVNPADDPRNQRK
jgi:quercetin dioxygenase-like cupin family protein